MNRVASVTFWLALWFALGTMILRLHPSLRVRAAYHAQMVRWWLWYVTLPEWRKEALIVRGWQP